MPGCTQTCGRVRPLVRGERCPVPMRCHCCEWRSNNRSQPLGFRVSCSLALLTLKIPNVDLSVRRSAPFPSAATRTETQVGKSCWCIETQVPRCKRCYKRVQNQSRFNGPFLSSALSGVTELFLRPFSNSSLAFCSSKVATDTESGIGTLVTFDAMKLIPPL